MVDDLVRALTVNRRAGGSGGHASGDAARIAGGAIADIVERRRLLIAVQLYFSLVIGALAAITVLGLVTPLWLLGLTFAVVMRRLQSQEVSAEAGLARTNLSKRSRGPRKWPVIATRNDPYLAPSSPPLRPGPRTDQSRPLRPNRA